MGKESRMLLCSHRDGKETKPSKNEPNQDPGFVKNRTRTQK